MQSVMQHKFSQTPSINIERSTFDRSHGLKTTFDAGYLVPILVDEVLPGDSFNCRMSAFARLATPLKPIMDNLFLDTFFFAVPMRLLWNNWEKFNGAQTDPGDSTVFTVPVFSGTTTVTEGSLGDYLGLPIDIAGIGYNSIFHRAYNLIWNEWFRDENLQDSVVVDKDDGPDTLSDYVLLKRGKRHDYFTSCLPWPQKNATEVSLPLGTYAPVEYYPNQGKPTYVRRASDDAYLTGSYNVVVDNSAQIEANSVDAFFDPNGTLRTDLSSATAATINELREAVQLQTMYERDARGGTRYTEIIRSHFGVVSPDSRMQRPEYLGGGSSPINVHPLPQVSQTDSTPQGNLAAFATASAMGHGFNKSFTEHCVIIGLANVRADLTYQQGLDRMFSRQTRFDFYWPGLAHLGEQEVLNQEIEWTAVPATNATVFGYQERYAEYRYKPSRICGAFRSAAATPLDSWHLSQELSGVALDDSFIQESPPVDRVIATPSEPHMLLDAYFQMKCARPMPVYGVPKLGGRL